MIVIDIASKFKAAEPLSSKYATEVEQGLSRICGKTFLNWLKQIQCDSGSEFRGAFAMV